MRWCYNTFVYTKSPVSHQHRCQFCRLGVFVTEQNIRTGGIWSVEEQQHDINYLELKAMLLTVKTCFGHVRNSHILVHSDNTTTVVAICKQGSTQSPNCNSIACQIWLWTVARGHWLSPTHCPGVENIEADAESRLFNDTTEWQLSNQWFSKICVAVGVPHIDMFESRINFHIQPYCSWRPDPVLLLLTVSL